jgi:hypothetical protein
VSEVRSKKNIIKACFHSLDGSENISITLIKHPFEIPFFDVAIEEESA